MRRQPSADTYKLEAVAFTVARLRVT